MRPRDHNVLADGASRTCPHAFLTWDSRGKRGPVDRTPRCGHKQTKARSYDCSLPELRRNLRNEREWISATCIIFLHQHRLYCFPPSAPPGLLDIVAEQANDVREGRVETSAHHAVRSMLALPSLVVLFSCFSTAGIIRKRIR